jgi:small ligand-binding sensory domain FIST
VGSISYAYYEESGSDFWTAINTEEYAIGKHIHGNIRVTGDVGSTVSVILDDVVVSQGVVPYDINLIVGKQYKIIMTTLDGQVASKVVLINDSTTFINVALETPSSDWLTTLVNFIKQILGLR